LAGLAQSDLASSIYASAKDIADAELPPPFDLDLLLNFTANADFGGLLHAAERIERTPSMIFSRSSVLMPISAKACPTRRGQWP